MGDGAWTVLLMENGPWVGLTFYLLWRDVQKEAAVRDALNRNTRVLTELTTLFRERMPTGRGR